MASQKYLCPNCSGKGCAVCQFSGQITLSDQELSELQRLVVHPSVQPQFEQTFNQPFQNAEVHDKKMRGNLARILTFLFLILVSLSATGSWFFAHTFKPFFQLWSFVFILILAKLVTKLSFFKPKIVTDFLGKLEEDGISIKKSLFYPFF